MYYRSKDNGIFNLLLYARHGASGEIYRAIRVSNEEDVVESLRNPEEARLFEEFIWASFQRVRDFIEFKDFESFTHGRRQ
jgi:hypothetical protein